MLYFIIIILSLVILLLLYSKYKYKIKLFFKLHFKNRKSKINPVKFEDTEYTYMADDDIISGIEQFKAQIKIKINDATNTILNVIISDYPILVYKAELKHKIFNEQSSKELIEFIDTLTGTNYAILQQMPRKLRFYINQPYFPNNSGNNLKTNLFRYKKFKNIIQFFPFQLAQLFHQSIESQSYEKLNFTDFINYIYITSNNSTNISEFMTMFINIIHQESELINYCSRTLIFKNMNSSLNSLLTTLCFSVISNNPERYKNYLLIKNHLKDFKLTIEKTKSLIIILDDKDNIIFTSKTIIENNECKPIKEITTNTLFKENQYTFKNVIYEAYTKTKNKKILYIIIVLIKLMNQYKSDEFNERLEKAIYNLVDNNDIDDYYTTKLENYLYMLFLTFSKKPVISLIDLFKITIPKFEITTSINGIECLDEYDLREKDVNYIIKVLNLLKYAKEPKKKHIIISDYSKTTAFMKVIDHKLIKEDIYYEDFMELKRLIFECYKIGVDIKIINIVQNHFFKIYYCSKQYFKLNELNHNIFPIDYNHFDKDLKIYQNLNILIEFVNLKHKNSNKFLNWNSESYDSLFENVILRIYTILTETKNYISMVDNIKYVEFNIRNPLTITPNSIWKYPKLLNDTMLFDLTGKFSIAAKFLYSIFVDSSSLSKEVEKYKELFYEIGIEMDITNFEK